MDTDKFKSAYAESRNGVDHFCRNPLYPKFLYSDGVKECAEAGCYWLLDILGTEVPAKFKANPNAYLMIVEVTVQGSSADIVGSFTDNVVDYQRCIEWTDLPEGAWTFYIGNDGDGLLRCILPTEY